MRTVSPQTPIKATTSILREAPPPPGRDQGVRDALRSIYAPRSNTPDEWSRLLDRLV